MFKEASRKQLRFITEKGLLSTEDLWDLSLEDLNKIAKGLNKELSVMEEEDFLNEPSKQDAEVKLKFDIVLNVLNTKKDELATRKEKTMLKAKRQKLLEILEKKQDASLEEMSEEELKKALDDLR